MAVDEQELSRHKFLTCGCQEWQPIETAPKDAAWLLLWDGSCRVIGRYCHVDCRWEDAYAAAFMATHWMPLPEPPVLSR